ncbi:phosphotransferase enzyme family protein [Chengkuizengella axinellae]|uniref:Phosphotransferase n=1 Tax=Chengkuizengella axinellae TaxID=3064388 RepID=A0ABT9J6Q4_9BACL|nr:phosphotransferase [Chengkuizengella sp. 2205SS18-9]MDP5277127.1 phosphotransferase [Chengkuizengella sp. 2205SS18-9]
MESTMLEIAANRYRVKASSLKLLGGFDNNVFECLTKERHFILKFLMGTDSSSIKRELDWMNYLSEHGLNITSPIYSELGNLIEEIRYENKHYIVVAYEYAKGHFIHDLETEFSLIKQWGKVMGRMHLLAKKYDSNKISKYREWHESSIITDFPVSAGDKVYDKWKEMIYKLNQLSKTKDCYGVIHNDLHQNNFHVHENDLILFDFGDIEVNWFAYDIAICLFHAIQAVPQSESKQKVEFAERFIDTFLSGYTTENSIDETWIAKIPFFLNYRQIYSFVYFSKHVNLEDSDESVKTALSNMKYNIEHDIPFIELRF